MRVGLHFDRCFPVFIFILVAFQNFIMMCFFGCFLIYFSCLNFTEPLGALNYTDNLEFFSLSISDILFSSHFDI